ncbi:MAG: 30S ribosomal protein S2 [Ignavibacteriae bacterium]|jgi:small subunit ribosomal protein S2|nr:30S ribosomal protein S2 [Ignavibacteriota bacterium]
MAKETSVEALLESGAHFGHLTRRWNPKMRKFIYTERNGIHIIDLRKTKVLLDIASEAAHDAASQGKVVLFVGTKNQAKEAIQNAAKRCGAYYVSERWLGGMLTNFSTIRKSIKRLASIDKMEADGTFEKFTKKERLMLNRERERLRRVFGGIEEMTRIPGAIFVVDVKKEHIAIQEAKKLGIPVIGMVDTNCDPDTVNYPIPANDDSIRTIELIAETLAESVLSGREIAKQKASEAGVSGAAGKDNDSEDDGKGPRKMRPRRRKDDEAPKPSGDAPAEA